MEFISRDQIAALSLFRESERAIRDSFVAAVDGRAQLPPVGYLGFPQSNADCHIKFGHIAGDPIFVVKVSTGFYDNPSKGLPSNNGIVLAASAETGEIVAVIHDEGLLTELRTAIGGAIATLALARKDIKVVGIVGSGAQARQHIRALRELSPRPLEFLAWGRNDDRVREMVDELCTENIHLEAVADLARLCRRADAIVTTTPSATPLLRSDWVNPGTHITAVGADAPGKQELEVALVARADRLVMDLAEQSLDHGEFFHTHKLGLLDEDKCVELGSVLSGRSEGRSSIEEITIADMTGLAVQDIAITRVVLRALRVQG